MSYRYKSLTLYSQILPTSYDRGPREVDSTNEGRDGDIEDETYMGLSQTSTGSEYYGLQMGVRH